jgi:hypothetical protein
MLSLFYPCSTVIDHIPHSITEQFVARPHSNDLITHLVVGYFFENNIDVFTLLNDQVALTNVQFEQPKIKSQ